MDLILWRHAEAHDLVEGQEDAERSLTARGEKQALRMAAWLDRQLPDGVRILSSPARRCEQTALALGRKYKVRNELAPDGTASQLLELVQWPQSRQTFVVISHQPLLGQVVSQLLGVAALDLSVRKGAAWWLRSRERAGATQTLVITVQSPELL